MLGWGWDDGWDMPIFGGRPLLLILIVVGIVFYVVRQARTMEGASGPPTREILDRRYASGKITKEHYDHMKRDSAG